MIHTLNDYYQLPLKPFTNLPLLAKLHRKIKQHQKTYPLINTPRSLTNLKSAYLSVWNQSLKNQSLKSLSLSNPRPHIPP